MNELFFWLFAKSFKCGRDWQFTTVKKSINNRVILFRATTSLSEVKLLAIARRLL